MLPEVPSWDLEELETLSQVTDNLLTDQMLGGWEIPGSVNPDGEGIRFWWPKDRPSRTVSPPEWGLAGEFINLSEGPERILSFARSWGPLQMCEHSLLECRPRKCYNRKRRNSWEPLQLWLRYSRAVRGLIRMGVSLRAGKPMDRTDWWDAFIPLVHSDSLKGDPATHPTPWEFYIGSKNFDLRLQRRAFLRLLDDWVTNVGLRPHPMWYDDEEKPILLLSDGSLLENIVAHVLFAVTGTRDIQLCSNCGSPCSPNRLARTGTRRYCRHCGRQAAERDAARDYRRRKKEKNHG